MMEQARTGQKGIDLDIQRYLQYTKTGKVLTEANKATQTLTGGFKESAKALGTSTGNFSDLTSAVTGTIKAVSGLLSSIPVVGKAFAALGDAAAETATFAIGQVQANYDSFKELAKAGQIGADGVTGLARDFDKAGIPLATYTKLLGSHSEELAYFSSSALAGGKSFAGMIANMDGDSKQYMRNLGYSIEEIGDAAIEYQVLQRKRGIMTDMDNLQLSKGTAHYVEELNMMAKLTGQNVKDLKNQRDEVRRDSRFRSRLAALRAKGDTKGAEEMENFAAMMVKINPEIGKGFMDITSGAINTEAALKLTRSGMLDTAKEVQRGLETGAIDKAQAINMIIGAAKEASKYGGTMQSLAGLSEEAAAKFLDYASTLDTANMEQKDLLAIEKEIAKTKSKPDKATDKLSTVMSELEQSIATVNKFFIATPAATDTIALFSKGLKTVIDYIDEAFTEEREKKPIKLSKGTPEDFSMPSKGKQMMINATGSDEQKAAMKKQIAKSTAKSAEIRARRLATGKTAADEQREAYEKNKKNTWLQRTFFSDDTPTAAGPKSQPQETRAALKEQRKAQSKKISDFNTQADSDNDFTKSEMAQSDRMTLVLEAIDKKLAKLNDTTDKAARNATNDAKTQLGALR